MSNESVHFSVDGEGLTNLARNAMLSERPDVAWRLVAKGLIGDDGGGESVAEAILDGRLKLVNDPADPNLLSAVDDRAADYQRTLHYIYAGRVRIHGCWWRPVATVTRFSVAAKKNASTQLEMNPELSPGELQHAWSRLCAEWFTDPGEMLLLIGNRWTVWEPCGEPPFWWTPIASATAGFEDAVQKGRPVVERGFEMSSADVLDAIQKRAQEDSKTAERAFQEKRALDHKERLQQIAEEVRQQAADDTFVLRTSEGEEFTIPRAPFWHWALNRTDLAHHAPPWEPISPTGLKLMLDDPYHSDWMLGAGIELSSSYNTPVARAATNAMFALQEKLGDFEVVVLVDHGEVVGTVGVEIAVLPNLSPTYAEVAMNEELRAIIAEEGGAMAHLANVGRERGLTIIRVPNARTLYPPKTTLRIVPKIGRIYFRPWGY